MIFLMLFLFSIHIFILFFTFCLTSLFFTAILCSNKNRKRGELMHKNLLKVLLMGTVLVSSWGFAATVRWGTPVSVKPDEVVTKSIAQDHTIKASEDATKAIYQALSPSVPSGSTSNPAANITLSGSYNPSSDGVPSFYTPGSSGTSSYNQVPIKVSAPAVNAITNTPVTPETPLSEVRVTGPSTATYAPTPDQMALQLSGPASTTPATSSAPVISSTPTVVDTRVTEYGATVQRMSDGSFRYANGGVAHSYDVEQAGFSTSPATTSTSDPSTPFTVSPNSSGPTNGGGGPITVDQPDYSLASGGNPASTAGSPSSGTGATSGPSAKPDTGTGNPPASNAGSNASPAEAKTSGADPKTSAGNTKPSSESAPNNQAPAAGGTPSAAPAAKGTDFVVKGSNGEYGIANVKDPTALGGSEVTLKDGTKGVVVSEHGDTFVQDADGARHSLDDIKSVDKPGQELATRPPQTDAEKQAVAEAATGVAEKAHIMSVAQYALLIMQAKAANDIDDATKEVTVEGAEPMQGSQGSPITPVSTQMPNNAMDGTTIADSAAALTELLSMGSIDLSLLSTDFSEEEAEAALESYGARSQMDKKESKAATDDGKVKEVDLTGKQKMELQNRRALLLSEWAAAATQIAEGSNAISSRFYERAAGFASAANSASGSLGGISAIADTDRLVLFELTRGAALSAVELGLKASENLNNLTMFTQGASDGGDGALDPGSGGKSN